MLTYHPLPRKLNSVGVLEQDLFSNTNKDVAHALHGLANFLDSEEGKYVTVLAITIKTTPDGDFLETVLDCVD
jgi:hypothetical protein